MNDTSETWPPEFALRLDAACCRFESALRAGQCPAPEEYVTGFAGDEREGLLGELLAVRREWQERSDRTADLTSGPDAMASSSVSVPTRFEILGVLGMGMGVVYKARDTRLNRTVAVKVIRHADALPRHLSRFRAEVDVSAALAHPNVVQVFDAGEFDGRPFLVLEYLPGGTLADRLAGGPLTPTEAARLLETLARAVHAVHERDIVHRDLKPANILFPAPAETRHWTETPKVADFGLVKRLGTDSGHTVTGDVMGTPAYMPPEQARGDAKGVGPAADVYALGAILYECLTGRPPFRGGSVVETIRRVIHDDPVPPRRLREDVPADLEAVCLKCLEKDAAHRYGTAAALADDLRNFLAGRPTDRPTSSWRRLEAALYARNVALAEREWAAGRPQNAGPYLDACPVASRGWEWYCLRGLRERPQTLRGHTDVVYGVTFSPDGRRIATVGDDQTIRLWDAADGTQLREYGGHADQLYTPRFTPDGRHLVTASQAGVVRVWELDSGVSRDLAGHTDVVVGIAVSPCGRFAASASDDTSVRLWNLDTGEELRRFTGHTDMVNAVAFSPDGRHLASASYDQTVRVWELETGRELHRLCRHAGFVWAVAYSPDGRLLASAGGDAVVRVWETDTGDERFALHGHAGVVWSLAFTPCGTRLASAGWDKTVRLWDAATGQEMLVLRGHADAVNAVAFSPDGSRLASASDDRTVAVWVAVRDSRPEAAPGITLRHGGGAVLAIAVHPDGRRVVSAGDDRTARVWDLETGTAVATLLGHTALVGGVAVSPDGRRIATAGADKTVRLWDAETGREVRVLRGHTDRVYGVAFSPCSRLLATGGWDRVVRVWDVATGRELRTLHGHTNWVWSVGFSSTGARLVSGSTDRTVRVWDAGDGREQLVLRGHELKVLGVAFSPDDRLIASAGGDGVAKLWDAGTGAELLTLVGHTDRVTGVAFDRTGTVLATGSEDQTVRLWDVRTGEVRRTDLGHARSVNAIAFTPSGDRLASAGADGAVVVRAVAPEGGTGSTRRRATALEPE